MQLAENVAIANLVGAMSSESFVVSFLCANFTLL